MAGARSNVVQYVFEGNVLDLKAAIKEVQKLLKSSVTDLETYQKDGLTAVQKSQVQALQDLLDTLKYFGRKRRALNAEEHQVAMAAGKQALAVAKKLHLASLRAQDKANAEKAKARAKDLADAKRKDKEEADRQLEIQELISTASQENALQHSNYLESLATKLRSFVSPEAYDDVMNAVQTFRTAQLEFRKGTITEEQLAQATEELQNAFKTYNDTLRTINRTYQTSQRGIKNFNDLIKQSQAYMELMVSSMHFWLRMLRNLISTVKQGVSYFAEYVEALNFLEQSAGSASDEMLRFVKVQTDAFGLDASKVATVAAMFYSFANSMGFAADEATRISQNFTKLAQDIASLQNIDVVEAATKLRSALAGQSRALAQLGINVTDVTLNEWLMSKGINKTMNDMNEASQSAARYAYILDRTKAAQGDLSRTLQSPSNQLKILAVNIKTLVRNIGGIGTTFFMPIIKLLNVLLTAINSFLTALQSISASKYSSSIGDVSNSLDDMANSAEDAENAIKGLTGLDEINQFQVQAKTDIGVDKDILALMGEYDNLAGGLGRLAQVFEALGKVMAPIWDMLNNGSGFSLITELAEGLGYALYPVQLIFEGWAYFLNLLPEPLRNIISVVAELALAIVGVTVALTALKILTASKAWLTFVTILKTMWTTLVSVAKAIWTKITAMVASRRATELDIAATHTSILASARMRIANWWETSSWWAKAVAIIAAAGMLAGLVAGIVLAATASASSAASSSQSQFSGTPEGLAKGGVVTAPTLALIGEGKYNEAVVPLGQSPQFQSMKESIAEEVTIALKGTTTKGSSSSGQPVVINIDGRQLARALWPSLVDTQHQVGVKIK